MQLEERLQSWWEALIQPAVENRLALYYTALQTCLTFLRPSYAYYFRGIRIVVYDQGPYAGQVSSNILCPERNMLRCLSANRDGCGMAGLQMYSDSRAKVILALSIIYYIYRPIQNALPRQASDGL